MCMPINLRRQFCLVNSIDWYGDTVFNRLQIQLFLVEWRKITQRATDSIESELVRKIEEMAQRVAAEPHLYLKFYGD